MRLPQGRLLRSRVVTDLRTLLVTALDRPLTGYATLEPQATLLLDADGECVLTFVDGVPRAAYHTGTERGGPPALADVAASDPYRLELYALPPADLADVHDVSAFRVPPGMPAERLAGDPDLADRTRAAAPADPGHSADPPADDPDDRLGAVEAFLEDEAKIDAIQETARETAQERAADWGFADAVDQR